MQRYIARRGAAHVMSLATSSRFASSSTVLMGKIISIDTDGTFGFISAENGTRILQVNRCDCKPNAFQVGSQVQFTVASEDDVEMAKGCELSHTTKKKDVAAAATNQSNDASIVDFVAGEEDGSATTTKRKPTTQGKMEKLRLAATVGTRYQGVVCQVKDMLHVRTELTFPVLLKPRDAAGFGVGDRVCFTAAHDVFAKRENGVCAMHLTPPPRPVTDVASSYVSTFNGGEDVEVPSRQEPILDEISTPDAPLHQGTLFEVTHRSACIMTAKNVVFTTSHRDFFSTKDWHNGMPVLFELEAVNGKINPRNVRPRSVTVYGTLETMKLNSENSTKFVTNSDAPGMRFVLSRDAFRGTPEQWECESQCEILVKYELHRDDDGTFHVTECVPVSGNYVTETKPRKGFGVLSNIKGKDGDVEITDGANAGIKFPVVSERFASDNDMFWKDGTQVVAEFSIMKKQLYVSWLTAFDSLPLDPK